MKKVKHYIPKATPKGMKMNTQIPVYNSVDNEPTYQDLLNENKYLKNLIEQVNGECNSWKDKYSQLFEKYFGNPPIG